MHEVDAWLEQLGLREYASVFNENGVDAALLPELTNDDLKDLGISRLRDRKILLKGIASLQLEEQAADKDVALHSSSAERRQLTVMFCDLVGSVELSTRFDPEDVRELITSFQNVCRKTIHDYDGFIARYMGDGILVYFGYPVAHENSPERSVRAGLDIVHSMQSLNASIGQRFDVKLAVRVGIATGPVVVGDIIGEGASEEAAVVGETPNLAARLQSAADPDHVVVAPLTRQLLGDLFEYEELGNRDLKGIAGPVPLSRIVRERTGASRFGAKQRGRRTPLIGRQEELDSLVSRWRTGRDEHGQVVLVGGESGIGKSRLCEALEDSLAAEEVQLIRIQCSPFHSNTTFYPLIELIRQRAGIERDDPPEANFDRLGAIFSGRTVSGISVAELVAPLMSIAAEEEIPSPGMSPVQRKNLRFEMVLQELTERSVERPIAILIEDAHWSDPTTLELLDSIVLRLQEMRLILVVTHRPEFQVAWAERDDVTCIELRRLGNEEVSELVDRLIEDKTLPRQQLDEILAKTDGIPLFVEELTRMLLARADSPDDAHMTPAAWDTDNIPNTIQDLLLERIDQLGAAKGLAQQAACFGRQFSRDRLALVSGLQGAAMQSLLDQLADSGLADAVEGSDGQYLFKHAMVQEAAYESLLRNTRINIHGKIARGLEEELATTEPEVLAHHFDRARLFGKAIEYWQAAGTRAMGATAFAEACVDFSRALELLREMPESPERDEQELLLLLSLGDPLVATRGFAAPEVSKTFNRAHDICQTLKNVELQLPVLWGLISFYIVQCELDKANELANQFLSLANDSRSGDLILTGNYLVGATHFWRGEFELAREPIHDFVNQADPETSLAFQIAPSESPMIDTLSYLAWIHWLVGYPDQSASFSRQCIQLGRSLESFHDLAYALGFAAWCAQYRREYDRVGELATELIALSEEQEFPYWLSAARILKGAGIVRQNQFKEGIDEIEAGFAIWQTTGSRLFKPSFLQIQAEAYRGSGELGKSMDLVDEALAAVSSTGERVNEVELRRFKGELLENRGEMDEAERWFLDAIEVSRRQQARSVELRATVSLARLWQKQNRAAEACERLSSVFEWFTEGFATPDLQEARKLLEELRLL